jgi:hypothetical protein
MAEENEALREEELNCFKRKVGELSHARSQDGGHDYLQMIADHDHLTSPVAAINKAPDGLQQHQYRKARC